MDKEKLIKCCKDWGYFYEGGIHDKKDLFAGKNILDVGMGQGPHSVFYIINGAKSYTGVDPDMDLEGNNTVRNHTHNSLRELFPFSPKEITSILNNVYLYPCILEELDDSHISKYDIIVMTMVTEHLQNNPIVIKTCYKFLKPGGFIWSSHANYYFWNGHHELPRTIEEYNKNNLEHNKCIDWKHLYPEHHVYYQPNLNRITVDSLKKIFEKYFEIEWDKDLRTEFIPLISENIKKDFPELSIEDLISHHPVVIGKKRDSILGTDIDQIDYYHPMSNFEKNIKNLVIYSDLSCPTYPNNKYTIIYQKHLFNIITYKNNELLCELVTKNETPMNQFNSLGIHFRLYDIHLKDHHTYKFSFEMKSINNNTIGKKPKIYTGIKWITSDIGLMNDYQLYEFTELFKFSGSSKYRLGVENICFDDSFCLRNIFLID